VSPLKTRTLYLVRHAIAAERGPRWPDDSRRPLTHRGRARMRDAIAGLTRLGVRPEVVLTSPLVRAAETAQLLLEGLDPAPSLAVSSALAPGQPSDAVARALDPYGSTTALALVGHEPGLGELAAWLIGATEPLVFKKGGVCRIDVKRLPPAGAGQLMWLATPAMLRGLARRRA
jgi:phosphohistidine phosphatase